MFRIGIQALRTRKSVPFSADRYILAGSGYRRGHLFPSLAAPFCRIAVVAVKKRSIAWLICVLFLVTGMRSSAGTFPVSNGNNAGAGSLRQAILDANAAGPGPHTISFTVSGTINITSSLPALTVPDVTIDGAGLVTISGPGGDNTVALFILSAGANNTTIRGLTLQNTGVQPVTINAALSGVTLEDLWLRQTGVDYMNYGIYVGAAATGMTIRNVTITDLQKGTWWALRFRNAVNGLTIDGLRIYRSGPNHVGRGNDIRGIQFEGTVTNAVIRNSTFDFDAPGISDDGNYGIYCNTTVNGFTLDSVQIHDAEVYHLYFGGSAANINLNLCEFDNVNGANNNQLVRFNSHINIVTIDSCVFNGNLAGTTNDAETGLWFNGNMQRLTIQNSTFRDFDADAIYAITGVNNDNITVTGNTFTGNGGTTAHAAIHFTHVRNTTSDGGPVLISGNTFRNNTGAAIYLRPANSTSYVIPDVTIENNIISGTKSSLGGIKINWIDKIIITQNSIYNNQGKGIELHDGSKANCGYEGSNTPQLLSSGETAPGSGIYSVSVRMPAICGSGGCSLELFASEAGVKGVGGQHYVQTFTGLSSGIQTLTNVTGTAPGIATAPYGTWTATLRLPANNCGTSEFSNKIPIKVNGPAGVDLGIKLWLRGDDISVNGAEPTADGQVITGWEEFSGGGGPSATTVISNPVVRLGGINFNPVADLDEDVIRGVLPGAPAWITTPAATTVAVFNPQSASASGDRFFVLFAQNGWDYNNNKGQIEFYRRSNDIHSYRGSTLLAPPISGTSGVSAFNKAGVFTSLTTSSNHTANYNGLSMGSGNYNKGNFAITQWFIGGGYGPDANGRAAWQYRAAIDFAEVFTYNRALTAEELQKVQSYMALKYGIAMNQNYVLSNGTEVWDVSANATYSKEVAALVRDDLSILHQKQGRAVQLDEVISIGLGSDLAATNKDNNGEIPSDLSVLMWGNDSASTAFTQAFTAGTFSTTRMPRVWKVQKLNWSDQDITIQLKNGRENNYLLISNDPTFNTVSHELRLTKEGTVSLSSALLENGFYFTFGRQQLQPGGVLNGLSVWVKADMGVNLNGTDAITWEDQAPSQRVWSKVNTTPVTWESIAMNYNPAVRFAGTNSNYFRHTTFTNTFTQGEIFSVQSTTVNNVAGFPWQLGGTSGTTLLHYRYTNNNMYLHFGTNARRNFSFGTKNMAVPVILNVNSAMNSWTASLDGKIMSGPAAYTTSFAQQSSVNAIGVAYGSWFNGPVSEVILYNRKLDPVERLQVNSYMALKYGITLDQTTPTNYLASDGITTMWNAADNTGYTFNIAGIGRDDGGSLYQKQSRSINTAGSGNIIAMAIGAQLAASNTENTDSIGNDKSFLVWADNNSPVTYSASLSAGGNATVRMERVWKVDKTNWADRDITIKLYGSTRNTYLLISTDATFAAIDQEIAINEDSTAVLNSSLLPDGAYFTFGKQILGPGYVNSGVQVWLRADDGASAGHAWYDFSGNGADAAQAAVASQPVNTPGAVNFNPAFQFDGSNDYMDFAGSLSLTGTNPFTVVGVGMRATVTNWDAFLSHPGTTTGGFLFGTDASGRTQIHRTATGVTLLGTVLNNQVEIPYIATGTRTGNNFALYNNGAADVTGTSTHSYLNSNLRLGNRGTSADVAFSGMIPEVIVYNRALQPYELQRVHSYLALKYGLTMGDGTVDYVATDWDGTNGTRSWTALDNVGFGYRITGIGRDDLTKLNQKQSRSQHAGAFITIAAGTTIAADNALNESTIDDLSFFVWSDNNQGTTFSVPVTSVPNATFRMERVWKVDRTNWSDQEITVRADKIGVRYLLVHATDPAFGVGALEFELDPVASSITINTSDLPDGAYFTLATKIVGPGCVNNGVRMWLRADYNGTSSLWSDYSGNQLNATQATAGNQPLSTGILNFNPAIDFDGTNDFMSAGLDINPSVTDSITVFTVYNADAASANNKAVWGNDNGSFDRFLKLDFVSGNNGNVAYTGGNITGIPLINTVFMDDGTTNGSSVYINNAGTASFTQANSQGGLPTTSIGNWGNNGYFNGRIGEVIFYNRHLDPVERHKVHSYLALKYGITLDQATPADYVASDWNGTTGTRMWTAADNAGYNFRITGIGRDDCDGLYQKQSRNQEGGLVTVAIGAVITATNADNPDSIINNNSYFVFADNNLDTAWSVPITASGITPTVRMQRVWKVDKTNWTDQDLIFKYHRNASLVYFLVSTDASFATNVQELPLNLADSTVAVSSDLLPDGAYFTFAKEVYGPGYVNNGVRLWLRADKNVTASGAGTDVTNWEDFSGNVVVFEKNGTDPLPKFETGNPLFNYNPSIDFISAGAEQMIALNAGDLISPASYDNYSMFMAIVKDVATNQRPFTTVNTGNNHYALDVNLGGRASLSFDYENGLNIPAGETKLLGVTNGESAANQRGYHNGKVTVDNTAQTTTFTNVVPGTAELGAANGNGNFGGHMAEVIVYNRQVEPFEAQRIQTYLALKYGVTLDQTVPDNHYVASDWDGTNGTIYWNATNNAAYNNNIAGIGRDDKTTLLQKQSRSVNTANDGNMVAIGLESIAAANEENTGIFTDDLSFMVWGDNGLQGIQATEFPAELDPNGCSKVTRLQREWKVQETGTVSFVQVQLYLAGMVPNSATLSDFSLLIDDDGDFGNGGTSVLTPAVYDGVTQTITFENVDFVNGQYFTLVTDLTNEAPDGVLTNLYAWYRADKGVATATGVTQWNDQSISGFNAVQATAGAQPVYNTTSNLMNFNPSLTFDGTNDVMANAAFTHSAAASGEEVFAVILPTTGDYLGFGRAATGTYQFNRYYFSGGTGELGYLSRVDASNPHILGTVSSPNAIQLANSFRDNSGNAAIHLNGTQIITGLINVFPNLNYLNIGARRNNGASPALDDQWYNGQLAEVVVYNGQLAPADREKVASYLVIKYGITLSHNYTYPNGTVVWDQALNTGYGNYITGIGRDDCNGMHQKQSKSVHPGALVTVASGTEISPSNAMNLNVLEDNTALMAGDNNADISAWVTTEAPAGRNRIEREWKVQITGTIGTVTLQVPASTSTATVKLPAEFNGMYLLVDADGDFSSGAEQVAMVMNGNNWEVSYEFTENVYFTFATANDFLTLNAKVILQGAWNGTAMTTDLKAAAVLPATDPYGLNTTPSVSPNAASVPVVDWVLVELRDATDPVTVIASRAAFLLANGDVVDTNYTQPLAIYGPDAGSYYVVIRHRNHLGVMSMEAQDFAAGAVSIDFTSNATATYGSYAQVDMGAGIMGLWAGNVNGGNSVRLSAKPSDATAVGHAVMTHGMNTTADPAFTGFISTYSLPDVNLDGRVYYTASPSDHSIIKTNVQTHPANLFGLASYIIKEQLP